ncbi:MAG: M43 family zinc metalloprotease [Ferruginibacter sp.]
MKTRLNIILLLFAVLNCIKLFAQRECNTPEPTFPLKVDTALVRHNIETKQVLATLPYQLRIRVVVFANNDGTNRAAADSDIIRQMGNMTAQYKPHQICFNLEEIVQANSTDLNSHNASTEEAELFPYIKSNRVTLFLHRQLFDNIGGLNGTAYAIPNNYLSMSSNAIASDTNISTLGHEMGHCFGLYHTFATVNGIENILRTGACANCSTVGDLLCDTPADPYSNSYITDSVTDNNCNYTGLIQQACSGVLYFYQMDPTNSMAYGRRSCRNHFTNGQGSRARSFIASTDSLINALSSDNLTLLANATTVVGTQVLQARDYVTFNANLIYSGLANLKVLSDKITILPGTTLSPTTTTGLSQLIVNPHCQ